MIGYLGMLHPAEFLALRRQDLVLPRDSMLDKPLLYIHLRNPKTARFARRQHAKIEDCLVIRFLDALLGDEPMNHPLFPASASAYRKQWDHIMERLDVPHISNFMWTMGSGTCKSNRGLHVDNILK